MEVTAICLGGSGELLLEGRQQAQTATPGNVASSFSKLSPRAFGGPLQKAALHDKCPMPEVQSLLCPFENSYLLEECKFTAGRKEQ